MESRVYVVHVNPDSGLNVFSAAKSLGMMSSSYVWIATDWLSSVHGTPDIMEVTQGVLVLRPHIADSDINHGLLSRWNDLTRNGSLTFSSYTMHAYDSVWLVAHAVEQFLSEGNAISFSVNPNLQDIKGDKYSTLWIMEINTARSGLSGCSNLRRRGVEHHQATA